MTGRNVDTEAPVACSLAAARELLVTSPSEVFAPRTHHGVERRTFPVTLRVKTLSGATAMHPVTVALGIPDTATGSRFPITWSPPSHRRTLPSFAGVLEILADGDDALLRISGSYEPPLGPPGKVLDAVAGRRMAHASIQDLTNYVAARLGECAEAREDAFAWHPPLAPDSIRDRPPPEAWLG